MRRLLRQHEEKQQTGTSEEPDRGVVPAYLLDRQQQTTGRVLSSMIKQKRKEKAVSEYFCYTFFSFQYLTMAFEITATKLQDFPEMLPYPSFVIFESL